MTATLGPAELLDLDPDPEALAEVVDEAGNAVRLYDGYAVTYEVDHAPVAVAFVVPKGRRSVWECDVHDRGYTGAHCEHTAATAQALKDYRAHVKGTGPDVKCRT